MRHGVTMLLVAMGLTPGVDGLAKVLTASASPFMVTFLRFLSAGLIALCLAHLMGLRVHVPRTRWLGQIGRTALLVGATCCLVFALNMVPLAYAVGGFLVAPIVSTLVGAFVLGEDLTSNRIIGALLACGGAIMISEPSAALHMGSVLALIGGALLGLYLVATRASAATADHPLTSLAVQCLLGAALIFPFAVQSGIPALSVPDMGGVAALGALAATTHVLTVAAYERADTGVLAPFMYFNLIAAIAVGYFWFGEIPDPNAMIGLIAIGLGGVLTVVPPEWLPTLRQRPALISV